VCVLDTLSLHKRLCSEVEFLHHLRVHLSVSLQATYVHWQERFHVIERKQSNDRDTCVVETTGTQRWQTAPYNHTELLQPWPLRLEHLLMMQGASPAHTQTTESLLAQSITSRDATQNVCCVPVGCSGLLINARYW
jgi:hypothetical protein